VVILLYIVSILEMINLRGQDEASAMYAKTLKDAKKRYNRLVALSKEGTEE